MISNVSFKQTIVDAPLRKHMAEVEQKKLVQDKLELVTKLVQDLNRATEETGDTAYLSVKSPNDIDKNGLPIYYMEGLTKVGEKNRMEKAIPIHLDIINKDGRVKYSSDGKVYDLAQKIEFPSGFKFNTNA